MALVSALAWAYLVHVRIEMAPAQSGASMAEMTMSMNAPWHATDVALTLTMWAVMMVGMMAPAATPMLFLLARSAARRTQRGTSTIVPPFALGYLTIWIGFSACATIVQWVLHRAALLSPAMAVTSPRVAGALLVAAGIYQLTPAKNACLTHCQSPVGFLMSHWRDGSAGAFRMGLHHGIYCLGCCWALMAVLFSVGVMNLVWVAALTVFILAERLGQTGTRVARLGGAAMVATGIVAAFAACASAPRNPVLDKYPPGVTGRTTVTYYDVHGRTVGELRADMTRLGPKGPGSAFFGETRSPMQWTWRLDRMSGSCTIRNVQVAMSAQVTLPRWTPPPDTEPGLVAEWARFIAALETHEAGHKDISARAAREIAAQVRGLSGPCSQLDVRASDIAGSIVRRAAERQQTYDAETRHGATQGATFGDDPAAPSGDSP